MGKMTNFEGFNCNIDLIRLINKCRDGQFPKDKVHKLSGKPPITVFCTEFGYSANRYFCVSYGTLTASTKVL